MKKIRVTGSLCGEVIGRRLIPFTKASDAELWCFVWSAPGQTALSVNSRGAVFFRCCRVKYDVTVICIKYMAVGRGATEARRGQCISQSRICQDYNLSEHAHQGNIRQYSALPIPRGHNSRKTGCISWVWSLAEVVCIIVLYCIVIYQESIVLRKKTHK